MVCAFLLSDGLMDWTARWAVVGVRVREGGLSFGFICLDRSGLFRVSDTGLLVTGLFLGKRRRFDIFRPMRTAIYPGSFDPLTNGHLDVIQRAAKLFDRVIVAVAASESKHPLFSLAERLEMVKHSIRDMRHVEADAFDGLLADYVRRRGAQAVVRGLRAVSDFEFEFQLALVNRKLNDQFETIFMMPKETYTFLSSRMVKEIARLGGEVSCFVPAHVRRALAKKFANLPAHP